MPRTPVRPGPRTAAAARLVLTEFFLGSDDAAACARRSVDWLGAHAGATRAVCLAPDADGSRLLALAALGLTPSRAARLAVPLAGEDHPFATVFCRGEAATIVGNGARAPGIFGGAPVLAIPLVAGPARDGGAPGLLVVTPAAAEVERQTRWVAGLLGPKLAGIRGVATLTAGRASLERERALLDTIINAVPDPVLLTDSEGRMILANARAESLFTTTERASEGRRRAIALNNMLFSAALAGRTIDAGEPMRRELLLVDPIEGTDLLFELLSAVVGDSRHDVRIVSVLHNVTDLRMATDELEDNIRKLRLAEADARAERDRLDLIIDSVADPIVVSDPAGAIVLMNTPAERLFTAVGAAVPTEVVLRVRSNDAHFSSFVSTLMFASDSIRHAGHISLAEPATGRVLPVEAVAGKVLSGHGELMGVVTILHDQTEALEKQRLYEQVKRASEQLEEKVREATGELVRQNELLRRQAIQLEQASALKSQFLANMSHEFRTPLNAILGYTSLLLQGVSGELTAQQRRSLTRVDSSGRHLLALINDILDISRIEAGKMPVHITEFAVPQLIAEVLAEVEPIIGRTGLTVTRELPPTLPALTSDRQKVKQIVLNFLTNALKFTPEGSVQVTASVDEGADRVLISVTDSGIGIAEEDQAKVFEDFSQADNSPTRAYGGGGLGLAICRRLAGMLSGQITLQSKRGRGATFTLDLPRKLGA